MGSRQAEFDQLFTRYSGGTASEEEKKELYRMILTGDFDERINGELFNALKKAVEAPESFSEKIRLDRLYASKIQTKITNDSSSELSSRPERRLLTRAVRSLIAASIGGALLVSAYWFLFQAGKQPASASSAQAPFHTSEEHDFIVRFVDKQLVHLPDGSTALLNEGAVLTYDNRDFGQTERKVSLTGEAFFDIYSDPLKRFVVHSGDVITTVLGTAFNVKSIPNQNEIEVTVARGKVRVGSQTQTYDLLTADQQLTVNTATQSYLKKEVSSAIATEWKEQFLLFDDITMASVAHQLSQRFGVAIRFEKEHLKNCHVTATFFNNETLEHILDVVSTIHGLTYEYREDDRTVLVGGETFCD